MAEREKLVILGASGFIGAEVARLAVALGHDVTSVSPSGAAPGDEPWTQGVRWIRGRAEDPAPWHQELPQAHALVVCTDPAHCTDALWQQARDAGVKRVVLLSPGQHAPLIEATAHQSSRQAEEALQASGLDAAILRLDLVYGPSRPISAFSAALASLAHEQPHEFRPLRRERVAMAALRAALAEERRGVLEVDEVAHIGDAMMIQ